MLHGKDATIGVLLSQKEKYRSGIDEIKTNFFKMINVVNNINNPNDKDNCDGS